MAAVCKAEVVGSDRRKRLAWRILPAAHPSTLSEAGVEYQKKLYDLSGIRALSAPEQAILMLRGAAEVEHDLLIEYLFAASSLEDPTAAALITDVATEEMGHLLSVNNIMLSLGHEPYFGRGVPYPGDPFAFKLRAGSRTTLASFTAAESPDPKVLSAPDREELKAIFAVANQPDQFHPIQRVAILYEELAKLFKETPPPIAGDGLFERQAKKTESWARGGVDRNILIFPIEDVQAIEKALSAIMSQGEGFTNEAQSHFERFRLIYRGMFGTAPTLSASFSSLEPAGPAIPQSRVATASELELLTRLIDVRYQMLVSRLYSILARKATLDRSTLIDANLREMRFVLAPLLRAIRAGSVDSAHCPQFYGLPVDFDPFNENDRHDFLVQALSDTDTIALRLGALSTAGAAQSAISSLREIDNTVGGLW
jgi:rubrerythrin